MAYDLTVASPPVIIMVQIHTGVMNIYIYDLWPKKKNLYLWSIYSWLMETRVGILQK